MCLLQQSEVTFHIILSQWIWLFVHPIQPPKICNVQKKANTEWEGSCASVQPLNDHNWWFFLLFPTILSVSHFMIFFFFLMHSERELPSLTVNAISTTSTIRGLWLSLYLLRPFCLYYLPSLWLGRFWVSPFEKWVCSPWPWKCAECQALSWLVCKYAVYMKIFSGFFGIFISL